MDVSVIIVNYKTPELVCNCIRSVIEFTKGISYELIVVDNHSQDDIRRLTAVFGSQVKLIELDNNVGFGKANNEGVKQATGRNILFLNPDTLLINNAIKILSNFLDANEDTGACGGNLYDKDMLPALSFRRLFPGIRWEIMEMTAHKLENIVFHGNWMFNHTNQPIQVAYITGADLMVKQSVIDTIGCFSPQFFMYNEDTDLCLRIHRAGYKIQSIPTAKIQHLEGCSTKKEQKIISEKGLFLSEQGRFTYYQKNVPPLRKSIAQAIYRCSLNMLYFVSIFSKKHNSQAFLYRTKIIKELNEQKKTNILLILLYFLLISFRPVYGAVDMPIIAFYGVPDIGNNKDYQNLYECGFNVNHRWYDSLDGFVKACRDADKHGIKILGNCPELSSAPSKAANTLSKEKGFFGYIIQDEPSITDIYKQEKRIKTIRCIDSTHVLYMNLLPYYYPDRLQEMLKTDSYEEYLKQASATSCQQLSFDYYPILKTGIRTTWYHNLEMVRQESISSGKPFWGFVCSVPHGDYPTPSLATLRLQVYSNLAYGAQAIQYFTYWTPPREAENLNYHDGPISADGEKTPTYTLVQQMNKELRSVSRLFYGARILSVNHLGTLSEGTTRLNTIPVNLSFLKIVGPKGAIISQLQKDGHHYLAIVNKNYEKRMKVQIRTKSNIPHYVSKQLQEQPMKTTYYVEPGDILLFKLK